MTSLALRYTALSDVGLRRNNNQDSGYASARLLVVADGMGGAAAGDLASSEAVGIVRQLDRDLGVDAMDALEHAVARANERLGDLITDDPAVEGMGTTLEAMLWDGDKFATAHLGDSRTYRLRGGELTQLNTDHTFVQSLVDEGRITREEARHHPHKSLLLRAMLGRDDNRADFAWVQPQLGDRYLLCSDGLTDMVDDETIAQTLGAETIDQAATSLVQLALEGGGVDNVTVVIGEFVDASDDPDEHLASSDGQPHLVGAAASSPRPRTGHGSAGSSRGNTLDLDPEEIRYAPRPPSRWRWVRWIGALVVVAALFAGGGVLAYNWTQTQYYVAESDGRVAIFQGVQADLPGISLSQVDEVSDVELDDLTNFQRSQVTDGIEATDRADAAQIVEDLRREVAPAPVPTPTPTPTPGVILPDQVVTP
ncbi:protein phosphatase 2C [Aeromicrobium marinum DSM 15272]|uniref:Protein phosphatase 2C n=1 Tax=Aeromicrobium marinum DSM 15272 TaxID=585531 RepID=E2S8U1_9ACTN|nr:protein phosphatase 2C domain-containing protein [Aeromicrobium marinum]EFQ84596.1 protein phosphatase 2C [Aeromicrobium marinum DSM 15272]